MMALGIIGLLVFLVCLGMVIVNKIRKKPVKYWLIGAPIALIFFIVGVSADSSTDTPSQQTIDYQVLRRWDIPAGGIGGELLVSENATKEEVLALASSLRSKYLSEGHIFISIFDSLEAYKRVDDPTYPKEEFFKHQLVVITRNPSTGFDEIQWTAEGRGY
jgi:hypothetical protein